MIQDSCAALIETAREPFVGVREVPKNSNHGIVPDFANWYAIQDWREFPMGMDGAPWCASFVHLCGRLALGVAWPVPNHVDVDRLAQWALDKGCFLGDPIATKPEPGDLVLVRRGAGWGHVGIVAAVSAAGLTCIEGNTDGSGSREGNGVYERPRSLSRDLALVRWARLI